MKIFKGKAQVGEFKNGKFSTTDKALRQYISIRKYETLGCPDRSSINKDDSIIEVELRIPLTDERAESLLFEDLARAGFNGWSAK